MFSLINYGKFVQIMIMVEIVNFVFCDLVHMMLISEGAAIITPPHSLCHKVDFKDVSKF